MDSPEIEEIHREEETEYSGRYPVLYRIVRLYEIIEGGGGSGEGPMTTETPEEQEAGDGYIVVAIAVSVVVIGGLVLVFIWWCYQRKCRADPLVISGEQGPWAEIFSVYRKQVVISID